MHVRRHLRAKRRIDDVYAGVEPRRSGDGSGIDVSDLVRKLTGEANLDPRSIRNVYGMLHTFFHDAVVDELITSNPCVLKQGELPGRIDKDPSWRAKAVYSRDEVEQLISDERVPSDRRVMYGLLFLAGIRCGEMAALTWLDYEKEAEPLGKLLVNKSYSVRMQRVKSVKTKVPRLLAEWRLQGWQEMVGRHPQADDLMLPARDWGQRVLAADVRDYRAALEAEPKVSRAELARRLGVSRAAVTQALQKSDRARNGEERHHGMFRTPSNVYSRMRDDLDRLGLRRRRVHDTRRTMITLALNDGARRDVLQGITHGFKGDIIDLYNTPLWELKCQELGKLKLSAKDPRSFAPRVVPLDPEVLTRSAGTRSGTRFGTTQNGGGFSAPTTGLENVGAISGELRPATADCGISDGKVDVHSDADAPVSGELRTACARTGTRDLDPIGRALESAGLSWRARHDVSELTAALSELLRSLADNSGVRTSSTDDRFLTAFRMR
jgi:integrase